MNSIVKYALLIVTTASLGCGSAPKNVCKDGVCSIENGQLCHCGCAEGKLFCNCDHCPHKSAK
jgi:hypothetical protein